MAMPLTTTVGTSEEECAKGGMTAMPVSTTPTSGGMTAALVDTTAGMDRTKVFHAMNGYIFGNLEGYVTHVGDNVRWYVVALGSEMDLHTAHWHGQTVTYRGERTDVIELLPASMKTVDMKTTNLGEWLYHCHVTDHYAAGMGTRWIVRN